MGQTDIRRQLLVGAISVIRWVGHPLRQGIAFRLPVPILLFQQ